MLIKINKLSTWLNKDYKGVALYIKASEAGTLEIMGISRVYWTE